jgi:hypothetical protein
MRKIASCSAVALGLSLVAGMASADTVKTGATTMSSNPQTPQSSPYSLMPYITVSTSPYIGIQTAYNASDIWSQQSTMNEDLYILQYKQTLQNRLQQVGVSLDQRPIVEISGAVVGTAVQTFNNFTAPKNSGDINLSTAEIDINAMASKWATGFMSLEYDSSPPQTGSRVTNSRLYLSRGFVTIGDLDKSPFYFTAGQVYLPFGRYYSYMITTPLTMSVARVNDRAAILGYSKDGLFVQGYLYPGIDANATDTIFHAGGFNAGYKVVFNPTMDLTFGGGVISDITDAQGMAYTGANNPQFPGFTSFNGANSTYPFGHTVPGADAHAEFDFWTNTLVGEFVGATRDFASQDLTYNGDGAHPQAMHLELLHNFNIETYPSMVGVAYGHSWQALGLNLPQNSYVGYFLTSIWKNTIEEIEFRHDTDYSTHDVATAVNDPGAANSFDGSFTNTGTGKSRDMVTLQLGVYF